MKLAWGPFIIVLASLSAAGFWPEVRRWPVSAACWTLHNNRLLLRKKEGGRRRGGEEAAFTGSGAEFRQLAEEEGPGEMSLFHL